MSTSEAYPELDQFFGAYFNQDFDLSGDTVEEIVGCYVNETTAEHRGALLREIALFRARHAADLDAGLAEKYGYDFDPEPWGHTAASFFELVEKLVAAPQAS